MDKAKAAPLELETQRLLLRTPQRADALPIRELWRQDFVREYNCFGPRPSVEEV